jgi:hypothetical protein
MNPRHPSRQTYGLEQKGDGPVSPTEPEPSPAANPAAFGRRGMNVPAYPWKKFQTAWRNAVTSSPGQERATLQPSVACSGLAALLPELTSGWKAAESKAPYVSRLTLVHSAWLVKKRPESGGIGCCLRPTPTLRPHCPIYSSSDSTASGKALTVDPSTEKPCNQGSFSGASRGPHSRSRHSSNSRQSFFLFGAPALSE